MINTRTHRIPRALSNFVTQLYLGLAADQSGDKGPYVVTRATSLSMLSRLP